MEAEQWIAGELASLRDRGLYRHVLAYQQAGGKIQINGKTCLNFSCNDYLDLGRHPEVIAASREAVERFGCSAAASRLVTGTLDAHCELEDALAAHKGYPAALVFGSGFLTNVGVIPTLVGRGGHVFVDRLAHASLVDAIVLSRASVHRFRHNDPEHLDALLRRCTAGGPRLVVTESVFSMDGDIAPLPAIAQTATAHDAMLMVDEAHATGVFGPEGRGIVRMHGLESSVNISMGTLSKALAGYGGFVACSLPMRELLINRSRAFIYSTGLPPAAVGSAIGALRVIEQAGDLGERLLGRAALFRQTLADAGLSTGSSESQIVPVLVRENSRALALAERLKARGILAVAIRPPTVPAGTARLRLSVTLAHTAEDLQWAAEEIAAAASEEGVV